MVEGVCVVSADGRIVFANRAALSIFGRREESLVGRSIYHLWQLSDGNNQYDTAQNYPFQPLINLGVTIRNQEGALRHQNGQLRLVIYSVISVQDEQGERRILFFFQDITAQKEAEYSLLVKLKQRLALSREDERKYIAQELHDGPIQDLYALSYQLQALKRLQLTEQQNQLVENIHTQFQQVNGTIRDICQELRPPTLATFGLSAVIRAHADRFERLYPSIEIALELDDDQQTLPEHVRLTLFRICQEMLSNVAKHAEATHVLIRFEMTASRALLEIQDNGRGFVIPTRWGDLTDSGHLGLIGASERAAEINGQFLILSNPGEGTIIRVTVPIAEELNSHSQA